MMAVSFKCAGLKFVNENLEDVSKTAGSFKLTLATTPGQAAVALIGTENQQFSFKLAHLEDFYKSGSNVIVKSSPKASALISFGSLEDAQSFFDHIVQCLCSSSATTKAPVIAPGKNAQYFQTYGQLSLQQNMLQDSVRTLTYQKAMLSNSKDFVGKVVMDVGAGSGILSFFAIQAGAKKVFGVEGSNMAVHFQQLVEANHLADKVKVVAGRVEQVDVPEKVDMIVSEPMGYMLFNERMLESFVHARKWLKPNGKMFPSRGILYYAPFTDERLYTERSTRAMFWKTEHFCGVDLSSLKDIGMEECFRQPIKEIFDVNILMAKSESYTVNFQTMDESDLLSMNIPFTFKMDKSGVVHGIAFWFDVAFDGSEETVWLSTAPSEPPTHWYQVKLLFKQPIFCKVQQEMFGSINMKVHERRSYDIDLELQVKDTDIKYKSTYDLGNVVLKTTPPKAKNSPTDMYMKGEKNPWKPALNEESLSGVFP